MCYIRSLNGKGNNIFVLCAGLSLKIRNYNFVKNVYNLSRLNSTLFNEVSVKVAFLVFKYIRMLLSVKSVKFKLIFSLSS